MAMSAQQTLKISVKNPLSTDRTDQPVVLSLQTYGEVRSALVTCGGQEIPCQLDDINLDEQFDELCFLSDLKGKEQKTYTVTLFKEGEPRTYPARVYAEMLMRNDKVKEKNKHNNFVSSLTVRGDCANSYNLLHQGNHWHTSVKLLAELFHSSYIKRPANPHAKPTAAMQIHNPMPRSALFTVGIVVPIEQPPLAGATLRRLRQYRRICPAM